MSVFFCDSNCELWYTKVDELGIKVIGMPYNLDGDERDYDMGRETDFVDFYKKEREGVNPKTSALNKQNYIEYFEPHLAEGNDILYVHFSNKLSGTFDFMKQAISELKEKYPERTIKTVDTLSISMGAGLIVYEAARLWKAGKSDDEIIKWVEDNRQKYSVIFVADDLNFLKRGGRVSSTVAFIGGILSVKPIMSVDVEGKLAKTGTAKGFKNAMNEMVRSMKLIGENVADHPIVIIDADNKENADYLEMIIHKEFGEGLDIWHQPVGPTIGCHCGPGTVGVIFHSAHR